MGVPIPPNPTFRRRQLKQQLRAIGIELSLLSIALTITEGLGLLKIDRYSYALLAFAAYLALTGLRMLWVIDELDTLDGDNKPTR